MAQDNSLYPEPPQGIFPSPSLSANGNSLGHAMNHHQHQHMSPFYDPRVSPDFYPAVSTPLTATSATFDHHNQNGAGGLYTETSLTAMLSEFNNSNNEDHDMMRTSSLSIGSGPSAPSSAVGSPRSHHSIPPATAGDWPAVVNINASPNMVHQGDFFMPGEYSYTCGYRNGGGDYVAIEYPQPKSYMDPSMTIPSYDNFTPSPMPQHHHHHHQQHAPAVTPSYATSPAHSPLIKTDAAAAAAAAAHSPYAASAGLYPGHIGPYVPSTPIMDMDSGAATAAAGTSSDSVSRAASRSRDSSSFPSFSASASVSAAAAPYATTAADQQVSDDGEGKEKLKCPHPDCGRRYKDLRAHMLTHMNERPEKCPIQTCEYHTKGFARKYDKNRHTLTHYKGTMVCGFCPGSGSSAEKSFNRADVFKRHLTAVHGVEQTPPNSRKKGPGGGGGTPGGSGGAGTPGGSGSSSGAQKLATYAPDATGKCSTCSQTFSNAQEFYEHLDDCVLRIVQLEDPAEAVNASRLAEVENDLDVKVTLEKNQVPPEDGTPGAAAAFNDDDEDMDDDDEEHNGADGDENSPLSSSSPANRRHSRLNPAGGVQKSRGMTHSRGGVPFTGKTRSRRSRQNYPTSWGFDKGQMTMRKRVMTVFEGPRRLAKDDMMLSTEHEVRLKLSDGKAYVTDLDVQTMKRAEGFLAATEEEKGVWISDDPTAEQMRQMQSLI